MFTFITFTFGTDVRHDYTIPLKTSPGFFRTEYPLPDLLGLSYPPKKEVTVKVS